MNIISSLLNFIGNILKDGKLPLDTSAASGTADGDLYGAITANNWQSGVVSSDMVSVKNLLTKIMKEGGPNKVLWTGAAYMNENQVISTSGGTGWKLTERLDAQKNGFVLVWSHYENGAAVNNDFVTHFVPKSVLTNYEPQSGIGFTLATPNKYGVKFLYIGVSSISGYSTNSQEYTGIESNIHCSNNYWVLRAVLGV